MKPKTDTTATLAQRLPSFLKTNFFFYLSSNVAQRVGQVLLLVMLVYLGSPSDVYRFGLFTSFFLLAVPAFSVNTHMAVGRLYFDFDDVQRRKDMALSVLVFGLLTAILGCMLATGAARIAAFHDPLTNGAWIMQAMLIATAGIFVINQFYYILIRVTDQVLAFFWFGVIVGAGYAVSFAVLAFAFSDKLVAAMLAYATAQLLGGLYGYIACRNALKGARLWRGALRLSLPYSSGTVIYNLVQWCLNFSGRWIGAGTLTHNQLATYTLLTQFYSVLTIFLTSIFETHRVGILTAFAKSQIKDALGKVNVCVKHSLLMVSGIYAIMFAFLPLYPHLLPHGYQIDALMLGISAALSFAMVFSIRSYWIAIGIKRTGTFGIIAVFCALITILASVFLVRPMGMHGLLAAAALGTALLSLGTSLVYRGTLTPPR